LLRGHRFQEAYQKGRALRQGLDEALVAVCLGGDGQSCVGEMELVGICRCICLCSTMAVDHIPFGLAQPGERMT